MGVILDTNVLIRAERKGQMPVFAQYADYGTACISVITVSELLAGVHLANSRERKARRKSYVEQLITALPILDFTPETAHIHAKFMLNYVARGWL